VFPGLHLMLVSGEDGLSVAVIMHFALILGDDLLLIKLLS